MKKSCCIWLLLFMVAVTLSGCIVQKKNTVTIFAAKSLNAVMDELILLYGAQNPQVTFVANYDGSGTLQVQIEEGAACDIYFPAAQKQMNVLEAAGYLVDGTRCNVVNNQVCIVAPKGVGTPVTGIADLGKAQSIALAAGSVPVGKYTREALIHAGKLEAVEDASAITTEEIAKALGVPEINECSNVGAVAAAVAEGANEIGTVYYSDYKGYEDKLDIVAMIPYELTGNVIYPVAQIVNKDASIEQQKEAADFIQFLKSDEAKAVFEKYYFDTEIE